MDARIETLRQSVFEIEHSQRILDRQTSRRITAGAILGVVLLCIVMFWILL